MTTWILKRLSDKQVLIAKKGMKLSKDMLLFLSLAVGLALIYWLDGVLFDLIISTLSDAYLAVSVFVAVTLAGFYFLDKHFKSDLTKVLNKRSPLQVPCAAFLGALPGCGGAIIVVTQFVHGQMSFGALVAVLIATMGDAAFLLLSQKPEIALIVYSISLLAGILFGYAVNYLHGDNYLKSKTAPKKVATSEISRLPQKLVQTFLLLLVPGTIIGLLDAFQFDSNQLFGPWAAMEPTKWLGFLGAVLCIIVWISQPLNSWSARFAEKSEIKHVRETVVAETSFVSVWVILGFLCFEVLVYFTGLDLKAQFLHLGALAPLLAILIGFIPGCGPQIIITTLYINGVVPLSSQLANAISNDGDALFPAIALAPEAAIKATLYSAIPAFILGYGALLLGW